MKKNEEILNAQDLKFIAQLPNEYKVVFTRITQVRQFEIESEIEIPRKNLKVDFENKKIIFNLGRINKEIYG